MRHPKLKNIFSRSTLCCAANMTMHINETRQQVHAVTFQFLTTFFQLWPPIIIYRQSRVTYVGDLHDPVLFYNNINRTNGRRTCTVDQCNTPDDELQPWPVPVFYFRCFFYLRL